MTFLAENAKLLAAFKRGEQAALREVYMHYAPAVHGLLRWGFSFASAGRGQRFVGFRSEHDAEEMMQEIFRRSFEEKSRLGYDGIRPYKSYLLTSARNLVIDHLRRVNKPVMSITDMEEQDGVQLASGDLDPEAVTAERQLAELVGEFFTSLTEEEQRVYDLRFSDGLEQQVVSEKLDLSVYKVRAIERRVRKRLLKFLRRNGMLKDSEAELLEARV